MICPKCRAEYRRGFTVCADCDVALVEPTDLTPVNADGNWEYREPAATPGDPAKDPFCSFWKGTDLRVCTEICTVLDEAAIPHKTIRRQDHLFNLSQQSPYEIGVPASLYEKAELAIKEAFGTDDEGGETPALLSEENSGSIQKLLDMPIEEKLSGRPEAEAPSFWDQMTWRDRRRATEEESTEEIKGLAAADKKNWYPEDATAEAWNGEPAEAREMIEMSLQENGVRMRWDLQGAMPQLFVLPEDEERAKEIVREILEGEPPG